MKHGHRSSLVLGWAALILAGMGCSVHIGGTQERRLVDLNAGPRERRLQVAREYVNEQQLTSLRAFAQQRFPGLQDGDLATLGLAWQEMWLADGDHVMVVVTFMPDREGIDAAVVADYVADEVQKDLLSKLGSVSRP